MKTEDKGNTGLPAVLSEAELAKKRRQEGHRERVREMFEKDEDLSTFSDVMLLERFLFDHIPRKDTKPIAYDLMEKFGSLFAIVHESRAALCSVKNMTRKAADALRMVPAMSRRIEASRLNSSTFINSFDAAVAFMMPKFQMRADEICVLACLNAQGRLIGTNIISRGSPTSVGLDVGEIFQRAKSCGATSIILAHNHPSDNVMPSPDDINATVQLVQVLYGVRIRLVDHIIIGFNKYFSMHNSQILDTIYRRYDELDRKLAIGLNMQPYVFEPIPYTLREVQYLLYENDKGVYTAPVEEYPDKPGTAGYARRPVPAAEFLYRTLVKDVTRDETLQGISEQIRQFGVKDDDTKQ